MIVMTTNNSTSVNALGERGEGRGEREERTVGQTCCLPGVRHFLRQTGMSPHRTL